MKTIKSLQILLKKEVEIRIFGGIIVKKADKYKELFSKEYLMGPNSMRLLEEMLKKYQLERGIRVL